MSLINGRNSECPSQPPLLLYLPGIDGTGRLLFRQPRLQEQYRVECVAYDQEKLQNYEELADLAAQWIEALGNGGPAVVLAESFGGAVALTLALKRPELVSRLVLSNTFAYFPRRLIIRVAAWVGRLFPRSQAPVATRWLRGLFMFGLGIPKAIRTEFFSKTADVPMWICGQRIELIRKLDLRNELAKIATPTLVLIGTYDLVVANSGGRELAKRLPNSSLVERKVGHVALVHPLIDVQKLLEDEALWPFDSRLKA